MHMRTIGAGLALAAIAALSSTAQAAPVSQTISLNGVIAPFCSVVGGGPFSLGAILNSNGTVDQTRFASQTLQLAAISCNTTSATAQVVVTPLTNSAVTTPPAGFTNTISFKSTVTLGAITVNSGDPATTIGLQSGQTATLAMQADPASYTSTVIAGNYTGNIAITLNPGS